MNKVVFLDRDGTINVEVDYLHKKEDFKFEENADKAIKIINDLGYKVIVVTNQSGIARGYYTENDLKTLHVYLDEELNKIGAKVDAYYYCPHHPNAKLDEYKIDCECRKPEIGMFMEAAKDFSIDFSKSIIVGDKISDLEAGVRLGMKTVLVETGHGTEEKDKIYFKTDICKNLYEFALILNEKNEYRKNRSFIAL